MGTQFNPPSISSASIFFKASRSSVSLACTLESKSKRVYCKIEKINTHTRKFTQSNINVDLSTFNSTKYHNIIYDSNSEVLTVSVIASLSVQDLF